MQEDADFAVRCRNIGKTYGAGIAKVAALRGVDLDVRRGELLMLVGPSGCGKTSLISIIAAILDQDAGSCAVLGQDLSDLGPFERARFRSESLGFVFQVFNLLPALTALENVSVPLLIQGHRPPAGGGARRRPARQCRPRRAPADAARPAQRRPAAAGGDRAGARRRPAAHHLRRADQQPRPRHRAQRHGHPETPRHAAPTAP